MTFLSARDTPIARRFEIWVPNEARDALIFHAGDCDQNTQLALDYQSAKVGKGEGTIGQVWLIRDPAVRASIADDLSPRRALRPRRRIERDGGGADHGGVMD